MKRTVLAVYALGLAMSGFSQEDSITKEKVDTIKIGTMVIIKRDNNNSSNGHNITISNNRNRKYSNVRTNWWVMDLGFANVNDQTTYPGAIASGFISPDMNEDNFDLRNGKSVNVNIWVFMQRLNL